MLLQFADLKAFAEQVAARLRVSAETSAGASFRQRAFVATHLVLGVLPFGVLPVLLALGRAPSALDLAAFALSVAPILIALQLSRSGDLDRACALSAVAFASFATCVGAAQGGL
ncbi:PAS domain-containing sensor histidine kinase, partial [Hansschlegelia beijingensis]